MDRIAATFDRYVVHSVSLSWRTSVGTQKDGAYVIGIEWDASKTAPKYADAQALVPRIRSAIWKEEQMVLPSDRLMSRRFYSTGFDDAATKNPDCTAFAAILAVKGVASAGNVGDVWIRYDVSLMGPTSANSKTAVLEN